MKIDRESIFRIRVALAHPESYWWVRVWRDETGVEQEFPPEPINTILKQQIQDEASRCEWLTKCQFAKSIIEFEGVAAVEVTNAAGDGEVLYKEWPR